MPRPRAPPRSWPDWASTKQCSGARCRAIPAAGACASRCRRCCSASPNCCCSTSRPTTSTSKRRRGSRIICARYPHTLLIVSHDRSLLNAVPDHILHLDRSNADALHRRLRRVRGAARAAHGAEQGRGGQAGGAARASASLRRPVPRQGHEGAPGAKPAQDDREDEADRGARGRGHAHLRFSASRRNCGRR